MISIEQLLTRLFRYFLVPQRLVFCYFCFLAMLNIYTMRLSLDYAFKEVETDGGAALQAKNALRLSGGTSCQSKLPLFGNHLRATKELDMSFAGITRRLLGEEISNRSVYLNSCCYNQKHSPSPDTRTVRWHWLGRLTILLSFYVGYISMQQCSTQLVSQFERKWVLGVGLLISAICTLLLPMAIRIGGTLAYMVVRVAIGICVGPALPTLVPMIAEWVPSKERAQLATYASLIGQFSIIACNVFADFILRYFGHRTTIFYFFGIGAILWFVGYAFTFSSNPDKNFYIDAAERTYIKREIFKNVKQHISTNWLERTPLAALLYATTQHNWQPLLYAYELRDLIDGSIPSSMKQGVYTLLALSTKNIFDAVNAYGLEHIPEIANNVFDVEKIISTLAALLVSFIVSSSVKFVDENIEWEENDDAPPLINFDFS